MILIVYDKKMDFRPKVIADVQRRVKGLDLALVDLKVVFSNKITN